MHRISEFLAILAVVAVMFLGIQYAASVTPQRNAETSLRTGIPDMTAEGLPGIDQLPPETTIALDGIAALNGWYVSDVRVSLSATDNGSGVSQTLYSFDDYTWIPYNGTLDISSQDSTMVYYYSADRAGNREQIKSETIKIDTNPPVTTASLTGGRGLEGWYVSDVTVTLAAGDEISGLAYSEYSYNGIDWIRYTEPFVISEDGLHVLAFRSVDFASNVESIHSTAIAIDRNAPTTVAQLEGTPGLLGWYLSPVSLTLVPSDSASGVADTEYSFDGIMWSSYSGPIVFYGDGVYTVHFWSADFIGNTESERIATIKIDMNPPVTTASWEGNLGLEGWYVTDVNVTLSAADGESGVAYSEYSLGSADWVTYTGPFLISDDGLHRLSFRSVDLAGNTEGIQSVTIGIDRVAPTTVARLDGVSGFGGWFVSDVTLTLVYSDAVSGAADTEYSYDGIVWSTYSQPISFPSDGVFTVYFWSADYAGNIEGVRSVTFSIDKTAPDTITQLAGEAGLAGWYLSDVVVTLVPSDDGSGVATTSYSFDQVTWTYYSDPFMISGEGIWTVYFYSSDLAGNNEAIKSVVVRIDMSPPITVADLRGGAGLYGWYVSDVIVVLTPIDTSSGVAYTEFSLDGNTWTTYIDSIVVTTRGITTVYYRSSDYAGNMETIRSATVYIDRTPPVTTCELSGSRGSSGWYVSSVVVTLTAYDAESGVVDTEYSLDGVMWATYSAPFTVAGEGAFTLYFASRDLAGNTEGTNAVSIAIDMSPPTTAISLSGVLGNANWYISEVNVTLASTDSISGVASTSYSFDGSTWYLYNATITLTTEGIVNLYYFSTDFAGNVEQRAALSLSIDMTPPTTNIDTESYYSNGLIVLAASDDVSGVAHTYYSFDDESWVEYSAPFHLDVIGGQSVIDYYSVDNAGNEELPKSTTFAVEEVEVTSFVSYYPCPPCRYAPLTTFDVYFSYNRRTGYTLMTRGWLLWYNIDVKNELGEAIPSLSIAPSLPSDFTMMGLTAWVVLPSGEQALVYMYLNRTCRSPLVMYPNRIDGVTVSFDGKTIDVTNLPARAKVFVSIAMEFDLAGTVFKSPNDFHVESYTFGTVVQAVGTYYSWYTLPVVTHVVKQCCRC